MGSVETVTSTGSWLASLCTMLSCVKNKFDMGFALGRFFLHTRERGPNRVIFEKQRNKNREGLIKKHGNIHTFSDHPPKKLPYTLNGLRHEHQENQDGVGGGGIVQCSVEVSFVNNDATSYI